jgi:hypothetical protein
MSGRQCRDKVAHAIRDAAKNVLEHNKRHSITIYGDLPADIATSQESTPTITSQTISTTVVDTHLLPQASQSLISIAQRSKTDSCQYDASPPQASSSQFETKHPVSREKDPLPRGHKATTANRCMMSNNTSICHEPLPMDSKIGMDHEDRLVFRHEQKMVSSIGQMIHGYGNEIPSPINQLVFGKYDKFQCRNPHVTSSIYDETLRSSEMDPRGNIIERMTIVPNPEKNWSMFPSVAGMDWNHFWKKSNASINSGGTSKTEMTLNQYAGNNNLGVYDSDDSFVMAIDEVLGPRWEEE